MRLSFVFLCLSLASLLLAAIPSTEEEDSSLSGKKSLRPSDKQAKKKPARSGKKMLKKRWKKRVGATKDAASAGAGKSSQDGCAAQGDRSKFALNFFPKVLVELIGKYLDGSFSVVLERKWTAVYSWDSVAVDSERHYLITEQDIQASSHGDDKSMSLGSPGLSRYKDFHSSHDGRSLFFVCKSQEQLDGTGSDSSEITARWQVQDTGTKSLKGVTFEDDETSNSENMFMLSTNGKTLVSTSWETSTTSVYQIKEHGEAALASKKADFDGYARAVSGNGNRILMMCKQKGQLEVHDISGDKSQLVLEIDYAGATNVWPYALSSDGSKAAFVVDNCKLCIVDVDNGKSRISVSQLTAIDIPSSVPIYSLTYDAKNRLYAFGNGNLWLVGPSKLELVSLEEAQVPQGYWLQSSAVSPNVDYISLLFQSNNKNDNGEHHYQMIVMRKDTKDELMRLYRHGF